jgi:hypothetical protein
MKTDRHSALRAAALFLGSFTFAAACGGGNHMKDSPIAPGSTTVTGIWTGALTRPNGLGTITLKWDTSSSTNGMSGPMTLTNAANVSVTIKANGQVGGNDTGGYRIRMDFSSNAGDIPGFPSCTVGGSTQNTDDTFPSPYNKITVAAFQITYLKCNGFVDPTPPRDNVQEVVQLSLSK